MAFPGTYNFNYVRGDTFELKVYPKTTSGASFTLTDYVAYFTVAESKNSESVDTIYCSATISGDHIDCIIEPSDGEAFPAGVSEMVYQIYIYKVGAEYEQLYTIVEGTISVTDRVTAFVAGNS